MHARTDAQLKKRSNMAGVHRPNENLDSIFRSHPSAFSELLFAKHKRAIFSIDLDGLAFANFAFENVDA